jgi:hypothetical protein
MQCDDFRANWTDWHEGWLEAGEAAMQRHRDSCEACASYDRQMSELIGALGTLPLPDAEVPAATGTASAATRRARRPAGASWAALAATLALGIALGVSLSGPFSGPERIVGDPVSVTEPGQHQIAVAFNSPRTLEDVEFVVELPEGVELAGFPNQRQVRWRGRLAKGRSQLRLPLRVSPEAEDGRVVTRLVHRSGERRLVVPLESSRVRRSGNGDKV